MRNVHNDILDVVQEKLKMVTKLVTLAQDVTNDPPELMNLINMINSELIQMSNQIHQNITLVYTRGI